MDRTIKTRRIRFRYPAGSLERHFMQGDLVSSHMMAMLSAVFPEGEEFFIRSVRRYADQITEPELKKQVAGFIGQEMTHGREHRELNERLQQMGYPTRFVERAARRIFHFQTRRYPPIYTLAVTAALEHYTAVLAETLLTDQRALDLLGEGEVRSMLLWHAFEEAEHRAVTFDVYRAVGGSERFRRLVMRRTTITFVYTTILATLISLSRDPATYHPVRLVKSIAALRHLPFLSREVRRRIGDYNRAGFHPNDSDNTDLIATWHAELFGDNGSLTGHLL